MRQQQTLRHRATIAVIPSVPPSAVPSTQSLPLKEACVLAAHQVIAEHGIEALSLREVARALKVSHQAPYKHYPSRDHLLAEVIRRCFERFAAALNNRPPQDDPREAMHGLGETYLRYALDHPLEYRLMFGTPWPSAADHPDLLRDARVAFDVLRDALLQLRGTDGVARERIDADALFVWSTMHGLATILQSNVMEHLDMRATAIQAAIPRVMQMIDMALSHADTAPDPTSAAAGPAHRAQRSSVAAKARTGAKSAAAGRAVRSARRPGRSTPPR